MIAGLLIITGLYVGFSNFNPCGDVDFGNTGESASNYLLDSSKANSAEFTKAYSEDTSSAFACFNKFSLPTE